MSLNEFGLIGLGVMGKSLALNLLNNKVRLSVFNRQVPGKEVNLALNFELENPGSNGYDDLSLFAASLEKPRKILMMVNAGRAVDDIIENLLPYLELGDVIMDGGNSHFSDTKRRVQYLESKGINFLGIGISGGQEGARNGPSMMPGGNLDGYEKVKKYIELISAQDKNNAPCCTYIGPEGAGHFVKMVHNGIEYAEMQIIAELYFLMRYMLNYTPDHISATFKKWRTEGEDAYLLGITQNILLKKEGDKLLLDAILDVAQQKDTGGWSLKAALDLGSPSNTISDAVSTRMISALKTKRVKASQVYSFIKRESDPDSLLESQLKNAFVVSRLINHSIGFNIIHDASVQYKWNMNLSEIARIWTNGCIIKSKMMEQASRRLNEETDLLFHPETVSEISQKYPDLSKVVSTALISGIPVPVLSSALNFLLNITTESCSANLVQAQRDYFGAHTYKRIDKSDLEYFHTDW